MQFCLKMVSLEGLQMPHPVTFSFKVDLGLQTTLVSICGNENVEHYEDTELFLSVTQEAVGTGGHPFSLSLKF